MGEATIHAEQELEQAGIDLRAAIERRDMLGTRVDAVQIPDIIRYMEDWIAKGHRRNYIVVANVDTIMQSKNDHRMQEAKACLDTKIAYALGGNVSTVPEATIRTQAYQNHLLEIYKKWLRLQKLTPEEEVACAAIKSKVDTEKQTHGIGYMPSILGANAPHVLGLAVDMNENMLYNMASTMAPMDGAGGMNLTDYLRNPVGTTQGCKLCWGGTFQPSDPVHIQYCP